MLCPYCCVCHGEQVREKAIADQFEARRAKNKASRERKLARREERLTSVSRTHPLVLCGSERLGQGLVLQQSMSVHVATSKISK
jgi:hypothetical protein